MAARRARPGTSPNGRDPRPRGRSASRNRSAGAASGDPRSSGQPAPEPSDQARDAVVAGKAAPRRVGVRASSGGGERTFFGLSTARAVILAVVVCALALTLAMPLRTYFSQRAELDQVAQEHQDLEEQVAALELEKTQLNDPTRIAAEARTRLRWVMPGETPYTVQLPGDAGPTDEEIAAAKKSEGPWYRDLWESAVQPQDSATPEAISPPALVPAPAPAIEGGPVG